MNYLKPALTYIIYPIVTSIIAALLIELMTKTAPEAPSPPPITFTYSAIQVPKVGQQLNLPIGIGESADRFATAQKYLDLFNYGFNITEYSAVNTGAKVIRNVEIKPEGAEIVLTEAGLLTNPSRNIITDIAPQTEKRFWSIQKFPNQEWSATVGDDFFPAIESHISDINKTKLATEQYIYRWNYVFSSSTAPIFIGGFLVFTFLTFLLGVYCHKKGWVNLEI